MKTRKLIAAALGFAAGVVTAWLAAIVWPIAVAVFMWNEEEGAEC